MPLKGARGRKEKNGAGNEVSYWLDAEVNEAARRDKWPDAWTFPSETPEQVLVGREDQFREAMKDLPEREAVFLALWYGGAMQAEIAAQYGVTQQAVSFAIKRATARLRWMLAGITPKGRGFRRGRPRGRASGVMGEVAWAVVRGGR